MASGPRAAITVGLVLSTSGPYARLGQSALAGAEMAVAEVNAAGRVRLEPRRCDPGGSPALYDRLVDELLTDLMVRHVVGRITSWIRKDMIPVLERRRALLWYPCPY